MEKHCLKCGILFEVSEEKLRHPHCIDCLLCTTCLRDWYRFVHDNYEELTAKFPDRCNPTWEVFIGSLSVKEKVEFT